MSECGIISLFESRADTGHKVIIEVEIVHDGKTHGQNFLSLEKVSEIGAAVTAANGTVASFCNGTVIALIFLVLDV